MFGLFNKRDKEQDEKMAIAATEAWNSAVERAKILTDEINKLTSSREESVLAAGIAFCVLWNRFKRRNPDLQEYIEEKISGAMDEYHKTHPIKENKPIDWKDV